MLVALMAIVENKVVLLVECVYQTLVELRSLSCSVDSSSCWLGLGVWGCPYTLSHIIRFFSQ